MNNIDELRKIIAGAPKDTHYIFNTLTTSKADKEALINLLYALAPKSLDDIRTIIEQADRIVELEMRAKGQGILSGWMISADGKLRKQVGDL